MIPHFSSVMVAGRKLDSDRLITALKIWSLSVKSLADLVGYTISKSQLGIFCNGDKASWGGVEAIHETFLEIRVVFSNFPIMTSS